MTATVSAHPWSEDSLFGKAQLYIDRMESYTPDDWQFGFWSALSLELLSRATLSHISPLLLANASNWHNLTYALGKDPTAKKFKPSSVTTTEVLSRLSELVKDFNQEIAGFCTKHADRRNSELHTGDLAFASLGTSQWLPWFYLACDVLLHSMGKELKDFLTDQEGAQEMINSLKDEAAKAVAKDIKARAQVWSNKSEEEQEKALAQATAWATRNSGHRVDCPSCSSPALLQGNPIGAVSTNVDDDEVIQRQTMIPSSFECIACGLRISGFSKLSACGLGDAFTAKSIYTAAEFFELYTEDDLENARGEYPEGEYPGYEEDFNEY